jgi:hypothetical protein
MARRVRLHDFAIIGDVTERIDNDQVNAIGGAMGDGSRIERLWLQHTKVGLWFDGPMRGITVSGLRIVDMAADGLNFHRGVSDAVVEKSFVRGTGDDGIASWAGGGQNSNIIVRDNVVIAPVLANGIAIYGGRDIRVERNLVADTLTEGGGIHVGNRFGAVPVTGRVDIDDNLIVRGGSIDPRWRFGVGALWFYALDAPIEASIQVRRLRIWNSSAETILMMGSRVTGVSIDGLAGEPPVIATRAAGQARISGLARGAVMIHRDCAPGFRLELAPGTMRGATGAAACDRSVEDTDAVSIGW